VNLSPLTKAAGQVDELNLALTLVCAAVVLGITVSSVYFIWRYHASKKAEHQYNTQSIGLEIGWTIVTFAIFIGFFFWGSHVYRAQVQPVKPDYEVFVFAKRWMWKFHHPTGLVEINHLLLPTEKNIRLTMISEDVIHSFYVPELRSKQDVLPGTLTAIPIKALREGSFLLQCAEYCGTFHSRMGGKVTFMKEGDYRSFIGMTDPNASLAQHGKKLFEERGCISCHGDQTIAPNLAGLRDDAYIRESILYPGKVKRFKFDTEMPSFKDAVTESEIRALTEYIKELR
jgi:cytochrome c oxidase subunit 2